MSTTDDIKRLEERIKKLEREIQEVKASTGKLPTRPVRGGGAGGGGYFRWKPYLGD